MVSARVSIVLIEGARDMVGRLASGPDLNLHNLAEINHKLPREHNFGRHRVHSSLRKP